MTNDADKNGMTFVLAALFYAARISNPTPPEEGQAQMMSGAIHTARRFIAAAKAEGVQPPQDD